MADGERSKCCGGGPTMKALMVFAAVVLSTAGCRHDSCDEKCDCEGCSDREFDHCLDEFEDEERRADTRDCLPEWDDYLACVDDTARCDSKGEYKTDCGPEHKDFKECVD
jgi:hypothetical protein